MLHYPTGTGGQPATVGLNAGDGVNFVNVTGSNTDDIINIASTTNIGIPGMWAFKVNGAQITGTVCDTTKLFKETATIWYNISVDYSVI